MSENVEKLVEIGKITKPHGLKGTLKAIINIPIRQGKKSPDVFFLDTSLKPLPYFIENLSLSNNEWLVKIEDINDLETANKLRGKNIYVEEKWVGKSKPEQTTYIGFKLIDKTLGEIAIIEELLEMPMQQIARLIYKNKEVLVPLNQTFIEKVDTQRKILFINLPEGILDL